MSTESRNDSDSRRSPPDAAQASVIASAPRLSREQLEAAMRVMDAHANSLSARRTAATH